MMNRLLYKTFKVGKTVTLMKKLYLLNFAKTGGRGADSRLGAIRHSRLNPTTIGVNLGFP